MHVIVILCLLSTSGVLAAAQSSSTATLTFPANIAPVDVDNELTRLNPAYKQRAGSSYEIRYLPKATESLITRAALANEQKPVAFEIIRAFIYDFLHLFVLDGGKITMEHRKEAVFTMDARFKQLLTAAQLPDYFRWRNDDENALEFLIHCPPPDKLRDKLMGALSPPVLPEPCLDLPPSPDPPEP
jgi:hypothetical protein